MSHHLLFRKKHIVYLAIALLLLIAAYLSYEMFFKTLTIHPLDERQKMMRLQQTKERYALDTFKSDGCSGAVSDAWRLAARELPDTFPKLAGNYAEVDEPPFEYACIAHDRIYHKGEGGYVGRLKADNALREEILTYSMSHLEDIKERTGLEHDESALFLYEIIAEAVYRGVRIGGAPCTGQQYAWGYGYNSGVCIQ